MGEIYLFLVRFRPKSLVISTELSIFADGIYVTETPSRNLRDGFPANQQFINMAKKQIIRPQNPFILAEYVSPDYFCDRSDETEELISNSTPHKELKKVKLLKSV